MADTLIFAELMIPKGGDLDIGKVLHQAIYGNGKFIGSHNDKPLLNNIAYGVELQDGSVKRCGYSIIA